MNYLLLLLSAILVVGLSAPAYAQTISDNVVINEIDTNPNGDDSLAVSEWIELYNPTDSDVDISGWEIASTTVLKKTLIIPDGTIISPDKFLTFTNTKIWFTDSGELVELRNTDGIIIDTTPSITDLQNNFLSWQRSYDGYTDWEFSLGSPGGSNGKFSIPDESLLVTITVSPDKTSYLFDDTAIIGGTVSEKLFVEKPTFQVVPIKINISGPNYYQSISLYPDVNLNYETTLNLDQVLGINEGSYDVVVTYGDSSDSTSFSVGFETSEIIEDTISSFNIKTDEPEYLLEQSVFLTGTISELIPFESIKFIVLDPNGEEITSGNLFTTDGTFSTSFSVISVSPIYGTYNIVAEYSEQTTSTTFNLIENIVEASEILVSNSITFDLNDFHYLSNEEIIISGNISNFDSTNTIYYRVVDFTFFTSDGKSITIQGHFDENDEHELHDVDFTATAIPDTSGDFSTTVRLFPNTFSEGDYVIKGKYGALIAEPKTFTIVSEKSNLNNAPSDDTNSIGNPNSSISGKPSTDEKFENGYFSSNIKTMIEKVNRISDVLISITTQEKIISDQPVKPRVLSGSMITVDKDRQSDVNLQVMSESGICIIGPDADCLVTESTRKPGQIFDVVQVDGMDLNVRYSGPDVRLEKFSILPKSSDEFLPNTNWDVEVIKNDEISRFYYKITYKTLE